MNTDQTKVLKEVKAKFINNGTELILNKLFSKPRYLCTCEMVWPCKNILIYTNISGYSRDFMSFYKCLPDPNPKLLFPDPEILIHNTAYRYVTCALFNPPCSPPWWSPNPLVLVKSHWWPLIGDWQMACTSNPPALHQCKPTTIIDYYVRYFHFMPTYVCTYPL